MSLTQWIATIIEVLVIGAIIVGFMYEPVFAEWEEKQNEGVKK